MNQPEFPTVFRGYDPVQVDQHVAALKQAAQAASQAAEMARQEAAQSSVELTKLRQSHDGLVEEFEGQRRSLTDLEEQARKVSSPTFADLGERIGSMLALADEEAVSIRGNAGEDAAQTRLAAEEAAVLARAEADRYAEEVRSRADVDASEAVSRAKQEADSIIDDAAREAAARREEAEAYYEQQRATAAASAADFERTLGERRELATTEFTSQMAKQDHALAAVQERADLLAREAEEDRVTKSGEASRLLEAARTEATALVASAKDQAERIRRDSERELAAATARRDSITAQLSNVRNMLGTLGGPAAVTAVDAGHEAAASAEEVAETTDDEAVVAEEGSHPGTEAADDPTGQVEADDEDANAATDDGDAQVGSEAEVFEAEVGSEGADGADDHKAKAHARR